MTFLEKAVLQRIGAVREGGWYFPVSTAEARICDALVRLGLAWSSMQMTERDGGRIGARAYRPTQAGLRYCPSPASSPSPPSPPPPSSKKMGRPDLSVAEALGHIARAEPEPWVPGTPEEKTVAEKLLAETRGLVRPVGGVPGGELRLTGKGRALLARAGELQREMGGEKGGSRQDAAPSFRRTPLAKAAAATPPPPETRACRTMRAPCP